ncbi:MAG: hypothetical protein FOGNACKC_00817 [Anaerolineae bacterium]|nr:hypothetical protein [Anaerolineae bacterium]
MASNPASFEVLKKRYQLTMRNLEGARQSFPAQVHETNRYHARLSFIFREIEVGKRRGRDGGDVPYFKYWLDRADLWLKRLAQAANYQHLAHWIHLAENRNPLLVECKWVPYVGIACPDCWDTGLCQKCVGDGWGIVYDEDGKAQKGPCSVCKGGGRCHCQSEKETEVTNGS